MAQEPSNRLAGLATFVVLAYLGLLFLVLGYGALRVLADPSPMAFLMWTFVPVLCAGLLLAILRGDPSRRVGVALLLITLSGGVLAAELALFVSADQQPERSAADRLGRDFDERTRLEVIQALEAQGVAALPDLHGRVIVYGGTEEVPLDIRIDGKEVVPLAAAASNSDVVLCNESGPWIRYRSDERGYRNPPGLWGLERVDILTVGDSFTMGLCMEDNHVPAARLRERWPATLNLGVPGAGPLLELAALREFGPAVAPRVVVWMYYEGNDLADLAPEMGHPILQNYLMPGFHQGIAGKQGEVDQQIKGFMSELAAREGQSSGGPLTGGPRVLSILKLERVRTLVGVSASLGPPEESLTAMREVLVQADQAVEAWGGQLLFAYLPDYNQFALRGVGDNHLGRADVLRLVEELGLPVLDILPVFAEHPDPRSLWASPGAHYTEEGFDLLSQSLTEAVALQFERQ